METLKRLTKRLDIHNEENKAYYEGYKDALKGVLKDIRESEVTSVDMIESFLEQLLTK